MVKGTPRYFHLHLVSDSTGETLITMAKAASVQYAGIRAIEHIHPLVRSRKQIDRVLQEVASAPGIVLYTIVNQDLGGELERACQALKLPCVPVLAPVLEVFRSTLGAPQAQVVGAQHVLNGDYFRRIDALNFSMAHDDGCLPEDLDAADIVVVGISRTSKTPTSIYLANRGFKTANVPLVPGIAISEVLLKPTRVFVVGLVASPDRIVQVRQNRAVELADRALGDYVDRDQITREVTYSRNLCERHGWPVIDVTRRSIEETAAAILKLYYEREAVDRCEVHD